MRKLTPIQVLKQAIGYSFWDMVERRPMLPLGIRLNQVHVMERIARLEALLELVGRHQVRETDATRAAILDERYMAVSDALFHAERTMP